MSNFDRLIKKYQMSCLTLQSSDFQANSSKYFGKVEYLRKSHSFELDEQCLCLRILINLHLTALSF